MDNTPVADEDVAPKKNVLFEVTPASRVLAGVLFIALPFIGGYIGYTYGKNITVNEIPTTFVKNTQNKITTSELDGEVDIVTDTTTQEGLNTASATPNSMSQFAFTIKKDGVYVNQAKVPSENTGDWEDFILLAGGYGPIGMWYGKDSKNVYCGSSEASILPNAEPESFEVIEIQLGDFTFAKDKNYVYLGCKVLEGADPATFRIERTTENGYRMLDVNKIWFEVNENFNSI